jgi:hypothetical protein
VGNALLHEARPEAAAHGRFHKWSSSLAPVDPKAADALVGRDLPADRNSAGWRRERTVFGSIRGKLVKHEAQADRLPRAQFDRWTSRYHASMLAAHIGFEFDCDQIMERRPLPCSARE